MTLRLSTTLEELKANWALIGKPMQEQKVCEEVKEQMKASLTPQPVVS
jgi:hypothetical protein